MSRRILVPWAMPEIAKEALKKSKAEVFSLRGPRGELPTLYQYIPRSRG